MFLFLEGDFLHHARKVWSMVENSEGHLEYVILNIPPLVSPYTYPFVDPANADDDKQPYEVFRARVERGLNGTQHLTIAQFAAYLAKLRGILKAFADFNPKGRPLNVLVTGFPLDVMSAVYIFASDGFVPNLLFIWQRHDVPYTTDWHPAHQPAPIVHSTIHKDKARLPAFYYAARFIYDGKTHVTVSQNELFPAYVKCAFIEGEDLQYDVIPDGVVSDLAEFFYLDKYSSFLELYPGRGCLSKYFAPKADATYVVIEPRMEYAQQWLDNVVPVIYENGNVVIHKQRYDFGGENNE